MTHAEVGAHLLALWGLPHPVIEAVARHHDPPRGNAPFDSVSVTYIATALMEELEGELHPRALPATGMDLGYLDAAGLTELVPGWRDLARQADRGGIPLGMDRVSRWLRRNGGLLFVAIAVIGTLFGARLLELAVSEHQEALLRTQTAVVQVRAAGSDVLGQPQGVLYGARAVPWQFQTSARLRAVLTHAADTLGHRWQSGISRRVQKQAATLNSAVSTMMGFLAAHRLDAAKSANETIVAPAFSQFDKLLTLADQRLRGEIAHANEIQSGSTLAAAFGAGALLLVMILLFIRARRRRDLAESERRVVHEAQARLRALIDNSSAVVVVVAPDTTVLYAAGSSASVLGREPDQLHGTKLTSFVEPADIGSLLELSAGSEPEPVEIRVRHPDGAQRTCEVRATSLLEDSHWRGVALHIWDVSDRKALELELRLAQKLEAVGQLAAGIAHEINTPIQYVGDTSRFLDNSFAELMTVLGRLWRAARSCPGGQDHA